jgi:hypothetical protein
MEILFIFYIKFNVLDALNLKIGLSLESDLGLYDRKKEFSLDLIFIILQL